MKPGKKRRFAKQAAGLLFVCGACVFLALPVHRYEWMQQIDSSITVPSDANAGNSTIFVLLLLAAIVISQVAIMATAKTRREKILAIVIAVAAIALCSSRYWR